MKLSQPLKNYSTYVKLIKKRRFFTEKGSKGTKLIKKVNRNFSKGLMVLGGISSKGQTKLILIKPGVKINSNYK